MKKNDAIQEDVMVVPGRVRNATIVSKKKFRRNNQWVHPTPPDHKPYVESNQLECCIDIGGMKEFDFPKPGDIGIKRQHVLERKDDPRNPLNLKKIVFMINGERVEFINRKEIEKCLK